MKNLMKWISIVATITGLYACQSPGNLARSNRDLVCKNVKIPAEATVQKADVITHRGEAYVPGSVYIALATHSGRLAECGRVSQCVIFWTEYERDCEIFQRSNLSFFLFGYRAKCPYAAPKCDAD